MSEDKTQQTAKSEDDSGRSFSRVAKLREMFLTGRFYEIEDADGIQASLSPDELRLLSTCPGSPPLLSLRAHSKKPAPSTGTATQPVANGASVPPRRPPKPKDLLLKFGMTPGRSTPPSRSRISPRLWNSVAVFESGAKGNAESVKLKTDRTAIATKLTLKELTKPETPKSPATAPIPSATSPELPKQSLSPTIKQAEAVTKLKQDATSLQNEVVTSRPLKTNQVAPGITDSAADTDYQHAEPIATATPGEKSSREAKQDRKIENTEEHLGVSGIQLRDIPPGLKIVGVDPLGIHFLEDGNFFYAIPGISDRPDSLTEPSFLASQSNKSVEVSETPSADDSAAARRVRFSSDPILIFSTHSDTEYDRRNDELDPLGSLVDFMMEATSDMIDFSEVELEKTPSGIGFGVFGVRSDEGKGDSMCIFVQEVFPGGAADLCQKIKPGDQIMEINGTSLVNVTFQFATETIRNAGPKLHFKLGRPKSVMCYEGDAETEESTNPDTTSYTCQSSFAPPREDSFDTLQKMFLDAEDALRTNEMTKTVESGSIVQSSDTSHNDSVNSETYFTPMLALNGMEENGRRSIPRSVLKGTATAASTKRRQDAISHIIQSASAKVAASSSPQAEGIANNAVEWILATELYDTQSRVNKLETHVQTLEQQLTAQEAAADEAIERLCMQCRHLELELHDVQDQLHQVTRRFESSSPARSLGYSDVNGSPGVHMNPRLPPLGFVANTSNGRISGDRLKVGTASGAVVEQDRHPSLSPDTSSDTLSSTSDHSDHDLLDTFDHQRNKLRLVSTGALANRRPRSRIEVNPPPFGLSSPKSQTSKVCLHDNPCEVTSQLASDHLLPSEDSTTSQSHVTALTQNPVSLADVTPNVQLPHPILGVRLPGLSSGDARSVLLRRTPDNQFQSRFPLVAATEPTCSNN